MSAANQSEINEAISNGDLAIKSFSFNETTVKIVAKTPKGQKILGQFVDSITVLKSSIICQ